MEFHWRYEKNDNEDVDNNETHEEESNNTQTACISKRKRAALISKKCVRVCEAAMPRKVGTHVLRGRAWALCVPLCALMCPLVTN